MKFDRRKLLLGAGASAISLPGLSTALLRFMEGTARAATPGASSTASYRHSVHLPLPGKPAIDVWGWSGVINYQRTLGHATPHDLVELGREARAWGANMIEVMPFKIAPGGYVMSWNPDDPIAQPDHGVYFYDDPAWTDQAYREMFSQWHDMDLLASLCVNSIGATWGDIGPGWKRPTGNVEAEVMARWSRDFFNRFAYAQERGYLDILDTERVSGMEVPTMWTFNPGATPLLCAPSEHHKEGFVYSFCCAGKKRGGVIGLDDRSGYDLRPKYPFFSYQADSRPRKSLHSWGRFGGYSHPDWIVKQLNDYCRVRKLNGDNRHTALWWFNDVAEMQAPVDRQYLYGASLDPLRSAVATRLFTTGQFNAFTAALNPEGLGGLPERSHPRGGPMLHNNHLALFLPRCRQGGKVVVDRGHLGEFHDQHDRQLALTERLLRVSVAGAAEQVELIEAVERPGEDTAALLANLLAQGNAEVVGEPGAFRAPGGYAGPEGVFACRHQGEPAGEFPGGMRHAGEEWPANVDLLFAPTPGTYALVLELTGSGALEVWQGDERIAVETIASSSPQPLPVVLAVAEQGEQRIGLVCWDGELKFERVRLVRLADFALSQQVHEPAGFVARWDEQMVLPLPGASLKEQRRYTLTNDAPWLEIDIERQRDGSGMETAVLTELGCDAFDLLEVAGTEYREQVELEEVPGEVRLVDTTGEAPPMHVALRKCEGVERVSFTPRGRLTLESRGSARETLALVLMLPEGLYAAEEIQGKIPQLVASEATALPQSGPATVANDLELPVVRLVQLDGKDAGPFYVQEPSAGDAHRWWMARGGHSSYRDDATFLRLYLPAGEEARIERYGFIEGCVKGGIGAQHTVAIRDDVAADGCVARVMEVTPYVPAPPIEFAEPFTAVTVDGEPWSYYEGRTIYLPSRQGDYTIRTLSGEERAPHVVATQACLTHARWEGNTLTIVAEDPAWYAPGLPWYALGIHCEGRTIESLSENAERMEFDHERLLPAQREAMEQYAALRIRPGKVVIRFVG